MAEQPTYYITTAITYPNGEPHIGHAYEYISADVMARFKRLDGYETFFLTGTDEHGQKVQQNAEAQGLTPKELVDQNAAVFKQVDDEVLNISYDRFIRTTDTDHYEASQAIWRRMVEAGDIYLDKYSGWYSVRDEAFYAESETEVREDGERYSKETNTEVHWVEEESYFFRLSAYQDKLLKFYADNPDYGGPRSRFNEVIRFVENGLNDLSISRTTFDWGVPVPKDLTESETSLDHVMYVWVDALTNYLTGVGFPNTDSESFAKFWPADLHLIGKDISRFHCIFWPAFLMSAGIELPKRVIIHGHLHNAGVKMSKSIGNVVAPSAWVDTYGLDPVRFFLLREFPYGQDGSYTHEAVVGRKNSDLANNLGNLAQRSLSMIAKNCQGAIPEPGQLTEADQAILEQASSLLETSRKAYEVQEFHKALERTWHVLGETNAYFAEAAPWKLAKGDAAEQQRMRTVLYVTAEVIRRVALLIQPVIPDSATKLLDALAVEASGDAGATNASNTGPRSFAAFGDALVPGTPIAKPQPIFPRHEEKEDA
ncbi:methionine--tRNA ligase [Nesterenkonia alkaliphila]|uniref:Methionine--tRNA ligase n=1 Tax=Nesterenkonia alkaliphila TaxID=1463631 RepID=A0A7K1UGG1_9MICC|nr:methionine--tRNA ligase [Nesterenkonia alkaliphila]MVT25558.1 methionine--tRNA ligase [Nesterenkonia alkaliphila]GFZ90949.1 methionine--tRNA ligase [Nesterenkonia alkaliphila]